MDWSAAAARVVVEACTAHPDDVVLELACGDGAIARALAPRVKRVVAVDADRARVERNRRDAPPNVSFEVGELRRPPLVPGVSVVCFHDALRLLPPAEQRALFVELGRILPVRGLLVFGDVMWSMPKDMIDEPEQFGEHLEHVQTTATLERWVREAGFLPDLHRFGPAVGVMIAIRTETRR